MDDFGRSGDVSARATPNRDDVWSESEFDLPLEHVESVRVVPVDVRIRAFLARLIAKPRHDQLLELGKDAQRPLRPVCDRLTVAWT